jgi:hypothetical protein
MGGFGSGEYARKRPRKRVVEESLVLDVRRVRSLFDRDSAGTLTWVLPKEGNRMVAKVAYSFTTSEPPTLTLLYRWRDKEAVKLQIYPQTTRTQFGGRRWWFTCPWCANRVGKLYLVPGDKYFHCRQCHNLSYRSAQQAHRADRVLARLGVGHNLDAAGRREVMERLCPKGW